MRTTPDAIIQKHVSRGWWGEETLETIFRQVAGAVPERIALVDPPDREAFAFGAPRRHTYRELDDATNRLCAQFHAAGLRQDDRVIVQLPNICELVVVYLAAARMGLVLSPSPIQYGAHELGHIQDVLGARAYVSVDRFRGQPFGAETRKALPDETIVMLFGMGADDSCSLDIDRPSHSLDDNGEEWPIEATVDANDIFTICWTSGTTGLPKGVPRSYNHWLASTMVSEDAVELNEGAVLLNPFPFVNMASIGGFLFLWLRCRGTLVLHHPFDAGVFLKQLENERVVYTVAPPALLSRLLAQPQMIESLDLSNLQTIGSGSAPVPKTLIEEFRTKFGIDVINIFGSNEGACLVSAGNDIADPAQRALYFPRFGAPDVEWKNRGGAFLETRLVDLDSGADVEAPGVAGELRIAGPSVFDGYLDSAADNAEVFDEQGYFRTGDVFEIASADPDGRLLEFVGRCKDIIVRGGMKISPEELDALLADFPGASELACCGYPDAELHERVAVVVVPAPGQAPQLADITAHLEAKGVARFKWPERIAVADALPRNPLNKILRRELGAFLR